MCLNFLFSTQRGEKISSASFDDILIKVVLRENKQEMRKTDKC